MSDVIEWVLEMDFIGDDRDAMSALIREMSAATKADEPGALVYEYYATDDGTTVTVVERYADSAAAMVHLGNFGEKFAERFLSIFSPRRLVVYGPASEELRGALAGMGAEHLGYLTGFNR